MVKTDPEPGFLIIHCHPRTAPGSSPKSILLLQLQFCIYNRFVFFGQLPKQDIYLTFFFLF